MPSLLRKAMGGIPYHAGGKMHPDGLSPALLGAPQSRGVAGVMGSPSANSPGPAGYRDVAGVMGSRPAYVHKPTMGELRSRLHPIDQGRAERMADVRAPAATRLDMPNPRRGPKLNMPEPRRGPKLNMPEPRRGPTQKANSPVNDIPMSGGSMGMGMGLAAAVGGVAGGIYGNRDGASLSGTVKGALGGAVLGAGAGIGLPALATSGGKFLSQNKKFMSTAGSYSSNVIDMSRSLNSEGARTALFAGGGLLGGMAFGGGSNSKKRGFNRNRGSSIGH